MLIQLTTTQWLALPGPVKERLKQIFGIPRSEGTQMIDNRVLSDGHNHRDLSVITIERMQNYTGSESSDFFALFDEVLAHIDAEMAPKEVVQEMAPAAIVIKPAEEMFIEHNGKTYKLTEVPQETAPPVVVNAPLYSAPPNGANPNTGAPKQDKAPGKTTAKGSGKTGGSPKAKTGKK